MRKFLAGCRSRYYPKSEGLFRDSLETLCNELVSTDDTGFDHELRSVIFSHVSDENRLGQTSLEKLISYKTKEAHNKIEILKRELREITEKIVSLEKKASIDHRNRLEGALAAKQHELRSHEANKPIEVPKPEASAEQKEEANKLSQQLAEKKAELAVADGELGNL